MAVLLGNFSEN